MRKTLRNFSTVLFYLFSESAVGLWKRRLTRCLQIFVLFSFLLYYDSLEDQLTFFDDGILTNWLVSNTVFSITVIWMFFEFYFIIPQLFTMLKSPLSFVLNSQLKIISFWKENHNSYLSRQRFWKRYYCEWNMPLFQYEFHINLLSLYFKTVFIWKNEKWNKNVIADIQKEVGWE